MQLIISLDVNESEKMKKGIQNGFFKNFVFLTLLYQQTSLNIIWYSL